MGEAAAHEAALLGRRFGEFVLRSPLSGGGFGMVFLAEQEALAREAVVKVLHQHHAGNPRVVQRFLREAKLASLLDHPYAAHTYAFGVEPDGVLWIAMELVRGTSLEALLRAQGPIPLERFVPFFERMCEVVQSAHDKGIVHRDLKPANVMVLSRAGQLLPKLLDFGIAKLTGRPDDSATTPGNSSAAIAGSGAIAPDVRLTGEGVVMGSPHYMAPEQWTDSGATDARTDIYALGVIAFEGLTGRPPYRGQSRDEVEELHMIGVVPALGSGFPRGLDQVLATALAKRPSERYQSALDLAAAFRSASGMAQQVTALPQLHPAVRDAVVSRAPQPLADAVAVLEAARNAHQARDAMWQVVRVAVRLVATIALAGHAHVGPEGSSADPDLAAALRRLRERAPSDSTWLAISRELVARFASMREVHPIPELVALLTGRDDTTLAALVALREADRSTGASDELVVATVERGLELVARALEELAFLADYPLVVPEEDLDVTLRQGPTRGAPAGAVAQPAAVWMGARTGARPRRRVFGSALTPGRPALIDAAGAQVLSLWPFVQLREPTPGAGQALFFFDGAGRRGARLLALPGPFEIEDDDPWASLGDMLRESSDEGGHPTGETACPYPGLAVFTDPATFFGRERETEAFVNRLRVQPLLLVVGPSGAGKSSFVQAGLLGALPADWRAIVVRPGRAPIAGLAASLAGVAPGVNAAELRSDPDRLGAVLRDAARAGGTVLLVVERFEELFTLCDDRAEQIAYASAVVGAGRSAAEPVRVVLTLRDDFLVRTEGLSDIRSHLDHALHILTTPGERDLRRILVEPLAAAGYRFDDPDLPDEMVAAVAGTPAALALLSFTGSRLWDLRDRQFRSIGRKAYSSLGGVAGALAKHAEETLTAMPAEHQRLVREVFRHAVTAEGTRAVLAPAELTEILGSGPHATAVIEKLVAARLLVVSDTELGERIEIAHETLLDAWPRLVEWRREDAEGGRLRDLLRAAARQWDEHGRSPDLLWRGDSLAEYRQWRARFPGALTAAEESFAAASLAEAARSRRIRRLVVGGALAALSAVAVALLFLNARAERQRSLAVESHASAERSARDLNALLLAQYERQGRQLVLADDPLKGLAFLAEATRRGARGAAHDFAIAQAVRATDGELHVLRHDGIVARARFSPDGTRVLTGGFEGEARLWNASTGALLARLPSDSPILRVAFSLDGGSLALGSTSGRVALWDARSLRLRHTLDAGGGGVQGLEFSPDGARLVTHVSYDRVVLWDAELGRPLVTLAEGTPRAAFPLGATSVFSPDGMLVAAGDHQGVVRLWDARSGRAIAALPAHQGRVLAVRFSPDGAQLASAGQDHSAAIWRLADRRRAPLRLRHRGDVRSVWFSPDGGRIATASADGSAIVWSATTGEMLLTLAGHAAGVNLVAFSPDGARIATASDDATVQLWDAGNGVRLARRVGHRAAIRDLWFTGDGRRLVTASVDGSAIVWTAEPSWNVSRLVGHAGPIYAVAFSPDGAHVATAGVDETARIWDASTGRELLTLRGHTEAVRALRFSPDGSRLATGSFDSTVRLWDARTGEALATLSGHAMLVLRLAWTPAGDRLASSSPDGTLRLWQVETGEEVLAIRAHEGKPISGMAVAPTGTLAATTGDDGTTRLWDLTAGRPLARFEGRANRYTVEFDPDGKRAVSATSRQSAEIWRVSDGQVLAELRGHTGDVLDAAWGPGGELVVTASVDGTARIWDPATGDMLAIVPFDRLTSPGSYDGIISTAAYAPRGSRVIASGAVVELPHYEGGRDDFEALLRCRVPYALERERIVPKERDLTSCRRHRP